MRKRIFVTTTLAGLLSLGLALPMAPAGAATNGSRLARCERSAAERYARRLQGVDRTRAKRQFDNDIARCKRQFG